MNLAKKVALNTTVQIIGRVVLLVTSIFSVALTARYLGVADFGHLTAAIAFLVILGIFTDLGLSVYLIREWARKASPELFANVAGLRILLAALVAASGFLIMQFLPYPPAVQQAILILLLGLLATALSSSWATIFQAELKMQTAVTLDTIGRLISFALLLLAISWDLKLGGVVASAVAGPAVSCLFYAAVIRKNGLPLAKFDIRAWKPILLSALPLGLVGIFNTLYLRLDMFLLSLLKPTQDVGSYGVSWRVYETIIVFGSFFALSVFPVFSKYAGAPDLKLKEVTQRSFNLLILLGIPITVGLILTAEEAVRLIGGEEFLASLGAGLGITFNAATALQILAASLWISFIVMLMGQLFVAVGMHKRLLAISAAAFFFNLPLNLLLIPHFSLVGAAISNVLTEVLIFGLFMFYGRRQGASPSFSVLGRVFVAAAVMAIAMVAAKPYGLAVTIAAGSLSFAGLASMLKVVPYQEIGKLFK